jgi:hypothetical protein
MGLSIVGIIGVVGLGTEGTYLVFKHRQLQSATDSAAMSGVMALGQEYPRDPESEANAVAANLGFVDGVDGVTVTVNTPPVNGAHAGEENAVEVTISQPNTVSMVRMFTDKVVNVSARSVASQGEGSGDFCILALDPSEAEAMYMYNNATITSDCDVAVNSTDNRALYMRNNAIIGGDVSTPGDIDKQNNAEIQGSENTGASPFDDPYADVGLGTPGACTSQQSSGKNNLTLNFTPGHFCSGWDFMNNVTINLSAGTYYIDSKLELKNNVVVNATSGVTIVINGNYAIDISNNALLNITAPSSGNFSGIALYSAQTATSTVTQKFENNTEINISGAIYFPNQIVHFDNNSTVGDTGCTHVIGRKIILRNNAQLGNECDNFGVQPIGSSVSAQLVE